MTDIEFIDIDGIAFIKEVKKLSPKTLIIVVSSHYEPTAQPPDQKTPIELPILGYLKGFSSRIFP
jgi:two-component SAPR family response regulator